MTRRGAWLCPLEGAFTRLLVAEQIRRQLRALELHFARWSATIDPTGGDAQMRDWLLLASAEARQFRTSIPHAWYWRVPAASSVTLGGALLPSSVGTTFAVVSLGLLLLAPGSLAAAYRHKRELFLPGASWIDARPCDEQRSHWGPNLYETEALMFEFLESASPVYEYELDRLVWMYYTVVMMFVTAAIHAALLAADGGVFIAIDVLLLCSLVTYLWFFVRSVVRPNRVWA